MFWAGLMKIEDIRRSHIINLFKTIIKKSVNKLSSVLYVLTSIIIKNSSKPLCYNIFGNNTKIEIFISIIVSINAYSHLRSCVESCCQDAIISEMSCVSCTSYYRSYFLHFQEAV